MAKKPAKLISNDEHLEWLTSITETLKTMAANLEVLVACVQQQKDPETAEPTKTWLKTREFG